MSLASVETFYPWLDSKNSPDPAWCTGGLKHRDILFVFLPIPPSLAVVEIKTIPFDISHAIWGGSHGFTSGVVKDTVAACGASLEWTDGIIFLCFILLTLSFIGLLKGWRAQGVCLRTQDKKDHMLLEETLLKVISIFVKVI